MTMRPWKDAQGRPMKGADGRPIKCEYCPCTAPCTCPCDPWLPDTWPCNGLTEQYQAAFTFRVRTWNTNSACTGDPDCDMTRVVSVTLTAVAAAECSWKSDYIWTEACFASIGEVLLSHVSASCKWRLSMSGGGYPGIATQKGAAGTPPGAFPDATTGCVDLGGGASQRVDLTGVSIS